MEQYLPYLGYLACPIGMGLMMWMMMRGGKGQQGAANSSPRQTARTEPREDDRVATLHTQLDDVQQRQAAISAEIARLAAEDQPVEERAMARTGTRKPVAPSSRRQR